MTQAGAAVWSPLRVFDQFLEAGMLLTIEIDKRPVQINLNWE